MARTDKELVRIARLRYDRLTKSGVNNDALGILKSQLDVFYGKKKRYTKSGISINKKMNVSQRKTMRQILRQFLNNPESKVSNIVKTFEKTFNQYLATLSPTKKKQAEKEHVTVEKMSELNQKYKRIVQDKQLIEHYGSQVMREIAANQKANEIDFNLYRQAMIENVNENYEGMSAFEVAVEIINKVGEYIEKNN